MFIQRLRGFLDRHFYLVIAVFTLQVLYLHGIWSKARLTALCQEQAKTIQHLQSALSNQTAVLTIEVSTNGVDWATNALQYKVPALTLPEPQWRSPEDFLRRDDGSRIRRL